MKPRPFWSFRERLPVLEEGIEDPQSIGYAFQLLARLISSRLNWSKAVSSDDRTEDISTTTIKSSESDNTRAAGAVARVFLSYCNVRPDADLASAIRKTLAEHGCKVFSEHDLVVGQEWANEIDQQLRSSNYVIVLLSETSVSSEMVIGQVEFANRLLGQNRLRLLPVRVNQTTPLPYPLSAYLGSLQSLLWTPDISPDKVSNEILATIRHFESEPPLVPVTVRTVANYDISDHDVSTELLLDSGAVPLDSRLYVSRFADGRLKKLISHPRGQTVLVKGPRQVGKTSLLLRAMVEARNLGHKTVYVDFQMLDEAQLRSLSGPFLFLANRVARELRTNIRPAEQWDEMIGPGGNFTTFIEDAVLARSETKLSLILDETDRLFQYDWRQAFFANVRGWHNIRAINSLWDRFNLILAHSTEPALFINDLSQSPFNIGEVVRVSDFTRSEVSALNHLHGSPVIDSHIDRLMQLVGGHPFLVRRALYTIVSTHISLDRLEEIALDESGPFGDNLRRELFLLADDSHLQNALKQVLERGECDGEMEFQRLAAAGILTGSSRRDARFRCGLYQEFFRRHL